MRKMAEKSADYRSPVAQKVTTVFDSSTLMFVAVVVYVVKC
jgi:hypothetical protein